MARLTMSLLQKRLSLVLSLVVLVTVAIVGGARVLRANPGPGPLPATTNPVLNRDIDRDDHNIDRDRPENQPFNLTLCADGTIPGGINFVPQTCFFNGTDMNPQAFTIPSTTYNGHTVQRLVIEYVSGICNTGSTPPSSVPYVSLAAGSFLNGSAGSEQHFFPLTVGPQPETLTWAEPVRVYSDPGQILLFTVGVPAHSLVGCNMYISGYLTTM